MTKIYSNQKACAPCKILHDKLKDRDDIEWMDITQTEICNEFFAKGGRSVPTLLTDEGTLVVGLKPILGVLGHE